MNKPRRAHIAYVLLRHLRRRDLSRGVVNDPHFSIDKGGGYFPMTVPKGFIHKGPTSPFSF